MENKKNGFEAMVTGFLMMSVIVGFICGFAFSNNVDKMIYNKKDKVTETESSDVLVAGLKDNKTFGFDEKNVITDSDDVFEMSFGTYAGTTNIYFTLGYGNSKKEIKVSRYNYDNDDAQEYVLTFTSNVVDVFYGQFNSEPLNNTVFYLLENGEVCYSFVEEMVKPDSYGSFLTIENLTGIVKFYNGNSCNEETGACLTTVFAQKKDGKIYNLAEYVIL